MTEVLVHALLESLNVLLAVFIFNIILSFFENKITSKITQKDKKINPIKGALFGLIPQCGISVISADLYLKQHLTIGTLVAVFIACSDEAVPIILSNPDKSISVLPLLLIKFVIGFVVGFLADCILKKDIHKIIEHKKECNLEDEVKVGCCNHEINSVSETKIHQHLYHPLIHSVKLFIYVFVINFIFGTIIYLIGEQTFVNILQNNKFFTPIYATLIGLIPNCASSVIITNLYIMGEISFGTTIAGLISNAGLGMMVLFKNKNMIKKTIVIIAILVLTSLVSGYVINLIFGF